MAAALIGGLAGKPLLAFLFLLPRALLARLQDGVAFGLPGDHSRIVRSGSCLEFFEKCLLCLGLGLQSFRKFLFPEQFRIAPFHSNGG